MDNRLIELTCPHCGGRLEISTDLDVFACGYCGQKVMVKREGGTVSLSLLVSLKDTSARTAAELALARISQHELPAAEKARASIAPYVTGGNLSPFSVVVVLGLSVADLLAFVARDWPWGISLLVIAGLVVWLTIRGVKIGRAKDRKALNAYQSELAAADLLVSQLTEQLAKARELVK